MKLQCSLKVVYRDASHCSPQSGRCARALIMLSHCEAHADRSRVQLTVYNSGSSRRGTSYSLTHLRRVFTRSVDQGLLTLSFSQPPHDLLLMAEATEIRSLVAVLRRLMSPDGGGTPAASSISNVSPTAGVSSSSGSSNSAGFAETPSVTLPVGPIGQKGATRLLQSVSSTLTIRSASQYSKQVFPATLRQLTMSGLRLKRLESRLLKLKQLRELDISDNCLQELPALDSLLPQLSSLDVSRNQLRRLEPLATRLTGSCLATLSASGNLLRQLPDCLPFLERLQVLNVANNGLSVLPDSLAGCSRLRRLDVSGNRLLWLPAYLESLPLLESLDSAGNVTSCATRAARLLEVCSLSLHLTIPSLMTLAAACLPSCIRSRAPALCLLPLSVLRLIVSHVACRRCSRPCVFSSEDSLLCGTAECRLREGPIRHRRAALSHPVSSPLPVLELTCWACCQSYGRKRPLEALLR